MRTDPFPPPDSNGDGPREPSFRMSSNQLGVVILFVAIGVLFVASLVAYLITRAQVPVWRVSGSRDLPPGVLASTLLLLGASLGLQFGYNSLRRNLQESFVKGLWIGGAFALAFLVGQGFNWATIAGEEVGQGIPSLYAFTFYFLTGVHAAHVLGGVVPLGIVIHKARNREYSSSRYEGVKLCLQYWHYLGVIWLVLLVTMYVAT